MALDLYKKIRNLYAESKDFKDQIAKEDREMNEEELATYRKYFDDITRIEEQIKQEERATALESQMNDPFYNPDGKKSGKLNGDVRMNVNDALNKWILHGPSEMTEEERQLIGLSWNGSKSTISLGADKRQGGLFIDKEQRTSAIANPTYLAPITLSDMFNETKKALGPWMEACTQIYTATGETMYMPYYNDAGTDGGIESEGTDAIGSSTDLTAARNQLDAYWFSSTGVTPGWSTLRDSSYPVDVFIVQPLLKRMMRGINAACATGNGSSTCNGIASGAIVGEIISASTTPDADDFNAHLKLVDYAYHTGNSSGWMFNSNTMFKIAATVKSSTYNTEPLWAPSLAAGIPSTLYGYKYWINNGLDSVGANKKPVLFGDFSAFVIRWAGPLKISRLEERYAEKGQVGFLVSQYVDSEYAYNGTTYAPVKYMRNLGT